MEKVKSLYTIIKVRMSPELGGFPSEYYKKLTDKLAPVLAKVYQESFSLGQMPETFNGALISGDPTDPGSFRPVSLINVDCKILTKVLALRMEKYYHI